MPLISVVIPTYNRADLLPRAIQSVLNQTFKDFELIVVDDGSTDNTEEIVAGFRRQIGNVFYVRQPNSGQCADPKNHGIELSTGRYLAFLDSDDEWLPRKLEMQLQLLENKPALGFVGCNITVFDNKTGLTLRTHDLDRYVRNDFVEEVLKLNVLTPSAVMVRRAVIDNVGVFDTELKVADDLDMWLRISDKYAFGFVPEFLLRYCIHGGSMLGNLRIKNETIEYERIFAKHRERMARYPSVYRSALRRLGSKYCAMGESPKGRAYYAQALRSDPRSLKMRLLYLSSYFFGEKSYAAVYRLKREGSRARSKINMAISVFFRVVGRNKAS